MRETIGSLAARFGRRAVRRGRDGAAVWEGAVFLQPVTGKERQVSAGALGSFHTDKFLCLSPAELCPGEVGDGGWMECGGESYVVIAAQPVYVGEVQTHWRAVLERKDEDEV